MRIRRDKAGVSHVHYAGRMVSIRNCKQVEGMLEDLNGLVSSLMSGKRRSLGEARRGVARVREAKKSFLRSYHSEMEDEADGAIQARSRNTLGADLPLGDSDPASARKGGRNMFTDPANDPRMKRSKDATQINDDYGNRFALGKSHESAAIRTFRGKYGSGGTHIPSWISRG